jgi:hypothetical protein
MSNTATPDTDIFAPDWPRTGRCTRVGSIALCSPPQIPCSYSPSGKSYQKARHSVPSSKQREKERKKITFKGTVSRDGFGF